VALTSRRWVDRRSVTFAVAGRVPGVIAGALVVSAVSSRSLAIGLALGVLLAVALSLRLPPIAPTDGLTVAAGVVSGFMGTATGVGGPPMALLYQRSEPLVVRATLAAYFAIGTVLSIAALAAAGELTARQGRLGLLLLPGVLVGIAVSPFVQHHFHGPRFRSILLGVSAASAIVLLVEQL